MECKMQKGTSHAHVQVGVVQARRRMKCLQLGACLVRRRVPARLFWPSQVRMGVHGMVAFRRGHEPMDNSLCFARSVCRQTSFSTGPRFWCDERASVVSGDYK